MPDKRSYLVVIGGGAAGFFCAVNAARLSPGLQVTILEKSNKLLQKVKVSGGGRCNLTHGCFSISQMVKNYPRGEKFLKKAFHQFFTSDTMEWFSSRGVALKTEADGRVFPVSNLSQSVIDCLMKEAQQYGVEIKTSTSVELLEQEGTGWKLSVKTVPGPVRLKATHVCIACGGFAKPGQWNWITEGTGHTLVNPVPSLFTFNTPGHSICKLMGLTCPALVSIAGIRYQSTGPVLITHWGLSGPAILKMSAFAARELFDKHYEYTVIINWLPAYNENSIREKMQLWRNEKPTQKLVNTPWLDLPNRLLLFLMETAGIDANQKWADLPASGQNKLAKLIGGFSIAATGKTTFKEEFVTAGGISTLEVDPNTMKSRLKPNLYFSGEVLDVDGVTGGFNFQNAWTTGYVAAKTIAGKE